MNVERYPADLIVTKQDFAKCGWQAILDSTTRDGYLSMWQSFTAAAKQALEDERKSDGKIYWLLADACSMMLSPKSTNDPFKPFVVMDGQRSVIPDDYSKVDITFFAQIVDAIDDPWLKARLADIIWLKQRPRDIRFALMAIDSYRSIPLNAETWVHGCLDCWERAIMLARSLNAGAGSRLKDIESEVIEKLNAATEKDVFFALRLADLLEANHLGRDYPSAIAQKLELLASAFKSKGELHGAREYYTASAKWFKVANDDAKWGDMTVSVAESFVEEAEARISSDKPSYIAANMFYEDAIKIYRTIPHDKRAIHNVDERIAELHRRLSESGEKSLGEMGKISSPAIDIGPEIEKARNAVRGKGVVEALGAFVNLYPFARKKEIREEAIKIIRDNPLHAIIPATVISKDGRVIAKHRGMDFGSTPSDDDEIVIRKEMVDYYRIQIDFLVRTNIIPALEIMLLEHRLREADFIGLVRQSPLVPPGRERLFVKALFAGFDRDFVTALHLLVPQIENMVRYHLKQAGVKTTTLDSDGIETENGLSNLMKLAEVETLFREDVAFEIRSLFCDPIGPNLRNEVAHGLLDDEECQSTYSIYAWWFGLKLVFTTYLNAVQQYSKSCEGGGAT
jgi:hypothetical protein